MRNISTFLFCFFFIATFFSQGSNDITSNDPSKYVPKIAPPSPESFKFGTYGNVPVGLFTGTPNINVPLSTLEIGNIAVPISLNYSSNGIRVDEMNNSVGLGWSFINAGVIARVVRDKPDDLYVDTYPKTPIPDIASLGFSNTEVKNYLNAYETSSESMDTEPDVFTANFCGLTAKFFFDINGNVHFYDNKNYKIEGWGSSPQFIITTENGTKYYFYKTETTLTKHTNTGNAGIPPNIYISAWYLSKIQDINGNIVDIEYYEKGFTSVVSKSQTMKFSYGELQTYENRREAPYCIFDCDVRSYRLPATIGLISDTQQSIFGGKQIKKITDSKNNSVSFEYEDQTNDYNKLKNIKKIAANGKVVDDINLYYSLTAKNRLFLTRVENTTKFTNFTFDYFDIESLPERLTYSRDMWGYYNAKPNLTLIPQIYDNANLSTVQYSGADQSVNKDVGYYGLLKKITYPTGGSTTMDYENHSRMVTKTVFPNAQTVTANVQAITTNVLPNKLTASKNITFDNDQFVEIYIGSYFSNSEVCRSSFYYPGDSRMKGILDVVNDLGSHMTLYSYNSISNSFVPINTTPFTNNFNAVNKFYVKVNKNQTVTFKLSTAYFCSDIGINIKYKVLGESQTINVPELLGGYRIKSTVDNPTTGLPIKRDYLYSNAIQTGEPIFLDKQFITSVCLGSLCKVEPITSEYMTLTSTNINQLFSLSTNIYYSNVSESIAGKGKISHFFSVDADYFGNPIHGHDIKSSPLVNLGWKNGKEIETIYSDNVGTTLKVVTNNFVSDPQRTKEVRALSIRKNYMPTLYYDGAYNEFENLDIVQYKIISWFNYLQSQSTTQYLSGKPVTTSTTYYYNNPSHYQPTSEVTTYPDLSVLETTYQYAYEKNNQFLVTKNMVGIPLETTVTKKADSFPSGNTIAKTGTEYPTSQGEADTKTSGLALPTAALYYDLQNNSVTEVTYDRYDSAGNLLQYTTKAGIPVAIIWGYQQTQPIAKIEGATYSQVSSLATALISAADLDAVDPTKEGALIGALNSFRTDLSMSNFQITTYTYDPAIGVTSITPPSGIRELYKYDAANRLQSVLDVNGNILKEYKYNYKP